MLFSDILLYVIVLGSGLMTGLLLTIWIIDMLNGKD